jgi:aromatic-L-amino-acid/L-tryptophan decarboxylase
MIMNYSEILNREKTLDPENWEQYRKLAHQMVDDVFDNLSTIETKPVWTQPPEDIKQTFMQPIPKKGETIENVYKEFYHNILPYPKGNIHPMFFAWVDGTGTITGVMADMLASAMNSNLGVADHIAVYVERQVINWCKEIADFPQTSSGVMVSGGSVANITALIVARNHLDNGFIKEQGLTTFGKELILYCSTETHNCVFKAAQIIGIGMNNIRKVSVNKNFEIDLALLEKQIEKDLQEGFLPFCIVGNAGTVNTGAIDPLEKLSMISKKYNLWFHVDGAIGTVVKLLPEFENELKGLELADSVAFDLHKWLYINYEVACVLIRDSETHKAAFSQQADYLAKHERGLASGPDSFSFYGMELSRNFKSLKVWMNLKEHGIDQYREMIRKNIGQAFYVADEIHRSDFLELMAPCVLNIVCFRYHPAECNDDNFLNKLNKEILMTLHERGSVAPSYTILNNRYALRISITNHRTKTKHLQKLIDEVLKTGHEILNKLSKDPKAGVNSLH